MRASRLLSIMMLLQTRGRMSAPALAAELEVSVRTVLRDVDHLSAAGVPIWSDRGRDGGFQLKEGWSTQLTGLTELEAQAFFLAGLPGAATELGLSGASASAQLKMLSSLPAPLREEALRVGSRLHVDMMDWFRASRPPVHLQAVAAAVWNQRVLAMRYESWSGTSERVVKPLGLVLKAGVWYMAAQTEAHKEPRTFRLASIQALEVREATFRRPKNFNLATFWESATQRFESGVYTASATLRVTGIGMKWIRALNATVAKAADDTAQADTQDSNWTQIVIPIESINYSADRLLAMGAQVEVLAPHELRQRVQATLKELVALYTG